MTLKVYGRGPDNETYLYSNSVFVTLRERALATIMAEVNVGNLTRKAITFTTNRHTGKFLGKIKIKKKMDGDDRNFSHE